MAHKQRGTPRLSHAAPGMETAKKHRAQSTARSTNTTEQPRIAHSTQHTTHNKQATEAPPQAAPLTVDIHYTHITERTAFTWHTNNEALLFSRSTRHADSEKAQSAYHRPKYTFASAHG